MTVDLVEYSLLSAAAPIGSLCSSGFRAAAATETLAIPRRALVCSKEEAPRRPKTRIIVIYTKEGSSSSESRTEEMKKVSELESWYGKATLHVFQSKTGRGKQWVRDRNPSMRMSQTGFNDKYGINNGIQTVYTRWRGGNERVTG